MEEYLNTKGRIFDIQKYSVHDGPGIRTIIFLKGCFLRCRWCCNPESQNYDIENMISEGKSKITGRDVTVSEVMEEVMKDFSYYIRSGGGLTLSGGEFLYQPEFARDILRAAKESGINTAVESTAFAKKEVLDMVLPYIDNFLMDIKHFNSSKHKEYTGVPNEMILENAKYISESPASLSIRVPVIPGFNHTVEEIRDIAQFAGNLKIKRLHLLPYHNFGENKYEGLNRNYSLKGTKKLEDGYVETLKTECEKYVGEVWIGG